VILIKSDCIIKEITYKGPTIGLGDIHIAQIKGQEMPKRKIAVRYQNLETGDLYLCLSGAIAWPGEKPGFILLGAMQEIEGKADPVLVGLEEHQDSFIRNLILKARELSRKYTENCAAVPFSWLGDPETGYNSMIDRVKWVFRKRQLYFNLDYPPHYDDKAAFRVYCRTIFSLGKKDVKRISLARCPILNKELSQILSDEIIQKSKVSDYPAVAALGYLLTYFIEYEPWLLVEDRPLPIPTLYDDYERVAIKAEEQTLKALYGEDIVDNLWDDGPIEWGEYGEGNRDNLIPTIR